MARKVKKSGSKRKRRSGGGGLAIFAKSQKKGKHYL